MVIKLNRDLTIVLTGIFCLLTLSTIIGLIMHYRVKSDSLRDVVSNLNARNRAWWAMCVVLSIALASGGIGSIVMFGMTSFLALREFLTLTPTRRADHRTLFWAFFIFTPYQYYLVATQWYAMFTIFIPVYAFLFMPVRSVIKGDNDNFLTRTALIQWGLMVCVYCVSHAPALMMLPIPGFEGQNVKLLLYLILVTQLSDVFQYVFGKVFGRHKVVPLVSPNKTWEGLIGGIALATAIGTGLWWITPFQIWQACLISLLITIAGFAGGLCMSAIKRDRGVKDFGNMLEGHGGVLDRIDSICFSAPLFFHVTRYYFTI